MIPLQPRFVNFRWRKDTNRWLFLTLLSVRLGSARVVAVNADEAVVDMALGGVEKYSTGTLAAATTPLVDGKLTTRWRFPPGVPIHFPTAKSSVFHAIRIPLLMGDVDSEGAGNACPLISTRRRGYVRS